MAVSVLVDLYVFFSVSQVVLMLFAVFFAYHIIRTIGTFWAWTLMVIAFGLLAVRDFTSVASVLSTPVAEIITKTEQFTITSHWPGTIINERLRYPGGRDLRPEPDLQFPHREENPRNMR
jgi:hypothetical protein